jgi:GTP-binding protein Era
VGGTLNRVLNRTAVQVATDADLVVMVADATHWTAADEAVVRQLPAGKPRLLALNKIDRIQDRARLMSLANTLQQAWGFDEIVPISARTGRQTELLADLCAARLPEGEAIMQADALTDRSERFLAAEMIREKLFRQLGDELPYESTVEIERFEEAPRLRRIFAAILVERDAQKAIVIGRGGERIKRLSTEARQELEHLLGGPVYLELFVKVRSGWADSEATLRAHGYE